MFWGKKTDYVTPAVTTVTTYTSNNTRDIRVDTARLCVEMASAAADEGDVMATRRHLAHAMKTLQEMCNG
jgi:glycerol-3-phosphate dehydrogenase